MSILIVVLVALILLGLALYAVQRSPIPSPVNWMIQLVLIVIAIHGRASAGLQGARLS